MAKDIDPGTYGQFSQLGLTHILAISGTHVAVYVASLLMLMSWLKLTRETALTVVLFLIPAYVLLSGGSPSVIRAGMMSMIGLYMAKRGLARDSLQIISAYRFADDVVEPLFFAEYQFSAVFSGDGRINDLYAAHQQDIQYMAEIAGGDSFGDGDGAPDLFSGDHSVL